MDFASTHKPKFTGHWYWPKSILVPVMELACQVRWSGWVHPGEFVGLSSLLPTPDDIDRSRALNDGVVVNFGSQLIRSIYYGVFVQLSRLVSHLRKIHEFPIPCWAK